MHSRNVVALTALLLLCADAVAGFSNASSLVSLDCLWSDKSSYRGSIASLVVRVFFPYVLLLVLIMAVYTLYFHHSHGTGERETLRRNNTTIFFIISFFVYQQVTEELLKPWNCITVDVEDVASDSPYSQFAVARGRYWAEDTDLKCSELEHKLLFAFLGVLLIALFTIGLPITLVVCICLSRRSDAQNSSDATTKQTFGFFFQNYGPSPKVGTFNTSQHHQKTNNGPFLQKYESLLGTIRPFWELVITARRIFISVVVVFAHRLGGSLQAAIGLLVIIIALVLQIIVQPFNNSLFNWLESASLVVSIVTLNAGMIFNDDTTTDGAKIVLAIFIYLLHIALSAVFTGLFCWYASVVVKHNVGLCLGLRDLNGVSGKSVIKVVKGVSQKNLAELQSLSGHIKIEMQQSGNHNRKDN